MNWLQLAYFAWKNRKHKSASKQQEGARTEKWTHEFHRKIFNFPFFVLKFGLLNIFKLWITWITWITGPNDSERIVRHTHFIFKIGQIACMACCKSLCMLLGCPLMFTKSSGRAWHNWPIERLGVGCRGGDECLANQGPFGRFGRCFSGGVCTVDVDIVRYWPG